MVDNLSVWEAFNAVMRFGAQELVDGTRTMEVSRPCRVEKVASTGLLLVVT